MTVLYNDRGQPFDGIRDYSGHLATALSHQPGTTCKSRFRVQRGDFSRSAAEATAEEDLSVLLLQYNPFCYARWGFAPWLPTEVIRVARRTDRPRIALMVHEPCVPMTSAKQMVMGIWQRIQLAALWAAADTVFVSVPAWHVLMRRWVPVRPVHHLPVGSNLPDMRFARERERGALGLAADDVVVAAMGRDHPSWLASDLVSALAAVSRTGLRPTVFLLGATAPPVRELDTLLPVHRFGPLPDADLASKLAAADIFVAPLIDGVSTRRGALMAAFQHELAVVGTDGASTDETLRSACDGIRLVPVGASNRLAAELVALIRDRDQCRALGRAGRELFERSFDWSVIARQVLAGCFSA